MILFAISGLVVINATPSQRQNQKTQFYKLVPVQIPAPKPKSNLDPGVIAAILSVVQNNKGNQGTGYGNQRPSRPRSTLDSKIIAAIVQTVQQNNQNRWV